MKILVIGSLNVDLITQTKTIPDLGETVFGENFQILPGGKGANQAVFAGLMGADVGFYGKVGNDSFSAMAIKNFKVANIDVANILTSRKPTGIANVIVSGKENQIIVVSGANSDFDINEFDASILDAYDILLLQQEIPFAFIKGIIDIAYRKRKIIILNPAPYNRNLSEEQLEKVTYLTPNEVEAKQMFGDNYKAILKQYPNKIIVTRGASGVIYYDGKDYVNINAPKVEVVDSTGAGDAFNGALAAKLSFGENLYDSVSFATNIASKTVEFIGTQAAYLQLDLKRYEDK